MNIQAMNIEAEVIVQPHDSRVPPLTVWAGKTHVAALPSPGDVVHIDHGASAKVLRTHFFFGHAREDEHFDSFDADGHGPRRVVIQVDEPSGWTEWHKYQEQYTK